MLACKMLTPILMSSVSDIWVSRASTRTAEWSLKICAHTFSPEMQSEPASSHQRGICSLLKPSKGRIVLNLKSGSPKPEP